MPNYVRWPSDYNRPLSREERDIARRLDNAPIADVAPTAEGFIDSRSTHRTLAPAQKEKA